MTDLGGSFITSTGPGTPWSTQRAVFQTMHGRCARLRIPAGFATPPSAAVDLIALGATTIVLCGEDGQPDPQTTQHDLERVQGDGLRWLDVVAQHPATTFLIELGNEPNMVAGLSLAAFRANALATLVDYAPTVKHANLRWSVSLPTHLNLTQQALSRGPDGSILDHVDALCTHLYGWYDLINDGGAKEEQAIIDWLLANTSVPIYLTEVGIDDKATPKATKAARYLAWLAIQPARIGGAMFWTPSAWNENPNYEIDLPMASILAAWQPQAPTPIKESSMSATLLGADRAQAFTPDEAKALAGAGIGWIGVYIGGPRNGGIGWSAAGVNAIAAAVPAMRFLPIYVGQNLPWSAASDLSATQGAADGKDAVAIMHSWGWGNGGPICLDVEYQTYQGAGAATVAYVKAWVAAVKSAGYTPAVYGNPPVLNAYAAVADYPTAGWCASWLDATVVNPTNLAAPGLTTQFTGLAWQFTGGSTLAGLNVDRSIASGDFPLIGAPNAARFEADPPPVAKPVTPPSPEVLRFANGLTLQHGFLRFWQKNGGLPIFGIPITDEHQENGLTVQYTERSRLEWHPNDGDTANFNVELGLVGTELLAARQQLAQVTKPNIVQRVVNAVTGGGSNGQAGGNAS